ncbi:uncharacterized protein LOC130448253 [Diorhabda sublineata]|uniref:uncharacterized protein LOC130448253 n=1 Tax=Diorhabda sublineata TaxID=1163346 RepID=UPI0024E0F580|nr:uncharacterized protein LOC130448253 [Diorhabda sublineata]
MRVQCSNLKYYEKHPILLSSKHKFTVLLVLYEHERLLHAGPQLLLSSLCEKYWPVGGRNLVHKISRNCIKCFRAHLENGQASQIMGVLPELRVRASLPFQNVDVDYGGPIMIRNKTGRGFRLIKAYIALFVCFSTKAIHLELVSDLTLAAFIACCRGFVSRRGIPSNVFSDNGTKIVGASSDLQDFGNLLISQSSKLQEQLEKDNVNWNFIPAHSPDFGGLWEAGVKSCKYHLKRVLGTYSLTFEGLSTLLTQVEAILNSRPLVPMSPSPNDFDVPSPGHFLVGQDAE